MLRPKIIDIFILRQFFQMFLGCFCICLFVFMMQFVWTHIEEMVGKGLGFDVLAKFFYYMAISLVPMALPMATLLTSLLTFGNMGEQLELTAMKAAGIPLLRIMRPVAITAGVLMCVSFCFQNYVSPKAQMEMARMLVSMKSTSPALEIPEGVFYSGIPNVNLYVERKDTETGMLYNVIIYKIDRGIENAQIVVADSARLATTQDKQFLKLSIFNGEQFENLQSSSADRMMGRSSVPYDRETFQFKTLLIDFNSDFDLLSAEELRNSADVKSLHQLELDADSLTALYDSIGRANYDDLYARYFQTGFASKEDTLAAIKMSKVLNTDTLLTNMSQEQRMRALQQAQSVSYAMLTEMEWRGPVSETGYRMVRRHKIKWHDKFTSSLACVFFFFIGAPLGAIIRKGGLGISTILSVLIFILYYIIGVSGMKMARDGSWNITYGMWISTMVMVPLGVWLTYRANKDATIINLSNRKDAFLRLFGIRPKRKYELKEVVIDTPDYEAMLQNLSTITAQLQTIDKEQKLHRWPNYIKVFFYPAPKNEQPEIVKLLEETIESLSNSKNGRIVYKLNEYPLPYSNSHLLPSSMRVRRILGILLPFGLAMWMRMIHFRNILHKDIRQIIETNQEMAVLIQKTIERSKSNLDQ